MVSKENMEETLVFLDFTEKLPNDILKSKVFFRVANLETPNPLVQVNDLIFKGTVQHCIGTNLFFKKTEQDDILEFPYKESSTTKLEFLQLQTKVINCNQMKVATKQIQLPDGNENVQFNLNWDYKTLLRKFEDGTLDIRNIIKNEDNQSERAESAERIPWNENNGDNVSMEEQNETGQRMDVTDNMEIEEVEEENVSNHKIIDTVNKQFSDELSEAYNTLLLLARTPVKRKVPESEEVQCLPQFKSNFEYRNIECKILCRPLFSYCNQQSKKTIENNINIDRCVLFGLLSPSNNQNRLLTDDEKDAVLTIENFENLDLPARLLVLTAQMREMEIQIECNTSEQNSEKDEFGRTPLETLNIYQRLVAALQKRISELV